MGIAGLLFLSGMLSFFELSRLSDATEVVLSTSQRNVESSQEMMSLLQRHNHNFVQCAAFGHSGQWSESMEVDSLERVVRLERRSTSQVEMMDSMLNLLGRIRSLSVELVATQEQRAVDEQMQAFVEQIYSEYTPLYVSALRLIDEYTTLSQGALTPRAEALRHSAYRAVTPIFISLVVMIVVVLLLYYFMMLYCVMPIVAITRSLRAFMDYKIPFAPDCESRDELLELRERIEQMTLIVKKSREA